MGQSTKSTRTGKHIHIQNQYRSQVGSISAMTSPWTLLGLWDVVLLKGFEHFWLPGDKRCLQMLEKTSLDFLFENYFFHLAAIVFLN